MLSRKDVKQRVICSVVYYLSSLQINHDIVWFNISVYYAHTVTVVQGLEKQKKLHDIWIWPFLFIQISIKNHTQLNYKVKKTLTVIIQKFNKFSHILVLSVLNFEESPGKRVPLFCAFNNITVSELNVMDRC